MLRREWLFLAQHPGRGLSLVWTWSVLLTCYVMLCSHLVNAIGGCGEMCEDTVSMRIYIYIYTYVDMIHDI